MICQRYFCTNEVSGHSNHDLCSDCYEDMWDASISMDYKEFYSEVYLKELANVII